MLALLLVSIFSTFSFGKFLGISAKSLCPQVKRLWKDIGRQRREGNGIGQSPQWCHRAAFNERQGNRSIVQISRETEQTVYFFPAGIDHEQVMGVPSSLPEK